VWSGVPGEVQVVADGLGFIEGPVALSDGSILLVDMSAGHVARIGPDGASSVAAVTGGSPNGAAIGPDGRCYVCNSGGFRWHRRDGGLFPGLPSADYVSGWIEAVDLASGTVERLYDRCGDVTLKGPNDLVFDEHGGFWFTDHGKVHRHHRDRGTVYYATADGGSIRPVVFPMESPNGIGLSPDGSELYVAETITGRLWAYEVTGPGELRNEPRGAPFATARLVIGLPGHQLFDSLAVDSEGNICVATIPSGISVISPAGELLEQIEMPDPVTTNICFGGADARTAYVTLSAAGQLVAMPWRVPGLVVNPPFSRR
jgi:gluconolactonase